MVECRVDTEYLIDMLLNTEIFDFIYSCHCRGPQRVADLSLSGTSACLGPQLVGDLSLSGTSSYLLLLLIDLITHSQTCLPSYLRLVYNTKAQHDILHHYVPIYPYYHTLITLPQYHTSFPLAPISYFIPTCPNIILNSHLPQYHTLFTLAPLSYFIHTCSLSYFQLITKIILSKQLTTYPSH